VIRVENLVKVFGEEPERALTLMEQGRTKADIREETGLTVGVNDVSFHVDRGEIFVIMGLSGSGKSTLLRCVNRLIEPLSGSVFLQTDDGEVDVTTLSDQRLREVRRDSLSMVFQRFGLLPHRTVLDNVAFGQEIRRTQKRERRRMAEEMLEAVGLAGWEREIPAQLSGGMQQRVGLARALATQANVLLMDEPFSALDPLIKVNMQDELLRIQAELHRTILFITHDLDEALRLGTRIAIMDDGQIVQSGTPEEIIVNPKTAYVSDFVEHADPTGVMTAKTVALPVQTRRFDAEDVGQGRHRYVRQGTEHLAYVLEDERFEALERDGQRVPTRPLAEALEDEAPTGSRDDAVLVVRPDATLKEVLQGRIHSHLPQVVVDDGGRLLGVISERELIHGILYKTANPDVEAAVASQATQEATA
jgi:glycine betaine/proline transport system ATP-binding protein